MFKIECSIITDLEHFRRLKFIIGTIKQYRGIGWVNNTQKPKMPLMGHFYNYGDKILIWLRVNVLAGSPPYCCGELQNAHGDRLSGLNCPFRQ